MNVTKLIPVLEVFQKGKAVADKEAWKDRQVATNAVAGLLTASIAAADAFGYGLSIPVSAADITTASAVLVAVANVGFTWATSELVGVGPAPIASDA